MLSDPRLISRSRVGSARWLLRPALALLICSSLVAPPASAQPIEISKQGQDVVDIVGRVADKVPFLGDFFCIGAKLLFATKEEPGYDQMKSEWEGFTTQGLENARVSALIDGRDGFKAILQQIHRIDRPGAGDVKNLLREKWKHLETELVKDIDLFHSNESEKAMPTLTAYGELVSLHLDTYLRLVALTDDQEDKLVYINEYNHHLYLYNKLLDEEINKAAKERQALVTADRRGLYDNGKSLPLKGPIDLQEKQHRAYVGREYRALYRTIFGLTPGDGPVDQKGVKTKTVWAKRHNLGPTGANWDFDPIYGRSLFGRLFPKFRERWCPECLGTKYKGNVDAHTHIWYTIAK
jgi:hypothetical protein